MFQISTVKYLFIYIIEQPISLVTYLETNPKELMKQKQKELSKQLHKLIRGQAKSRKTYIEYLQTTLYCIVCPLLYSSFFNQPFHLYLVYIDLK